MCGNLLRKLRAFDLQDAHMFIEDPPGSGFN